MIEFFADHSGDEVSDFEDPQPAENRFGNSFHCSDAEPRGRRCTVTIHGTAVVKCDGTDGERIPSRISKQPALT